MNGTKCWRAFHHLWKVLFQIISCSVLCTVPKGFFWAMGETSASLVAIHEPGCVSWLTYLWAPSIVLTPNQYSQRTASLSSCCMLSCVWLFATPWTVACQAFLSMDYARQNTGLGCHSLLQGIFPNQGSNPSLLHCRQILYCLTHQGSLLKQRVFYLVTLKQSCLFWMISFVICKMKVVISALSDH